jgi:hypothetical protein
MFHQLCEGHQFVACLLISNCISITAYSIHTSNLNQKIKEIQHEVKHTSVRAESYVITLLFFSFLR